MNLRVVVIRPSQDLQELAEEHVVNCSNSITTVGELKAAIESELQITPSQLIIFFFNEVDLCCSTLRESLFSNFIKEWHISFFLNFNKQNE
ncbi:hypothetical protein PRUPE_1G553600 [Prunus persica]|uniref:Ubiquitin-like domain-containing protein n=1 Tax=Prunus persica TaxID=3760 RepID=A0A251RIF4_PRUPE|nr:hypothetical protein PRUPE_1G553600 [Prunus persica]